MVNTLTSGGLRFFLLLAFFRRRWAPLLDSSTRTSKSRQHRIFSDTEVVLELILYVSNPIEGIMYGLFLCLVACSRMNMREKAVSGEPSTEQNERQSGPAASAVGGLTIHISRYLRLTAEPTLRIFSP